MLFIFFKIKLKKNFNFPVNIKIGVSKVNIIIVKSNMMPPGPRIYLAKWLIIYFNLSLSNSPLKAEMRASNQNDGGASTFSLIVAASVRSTNLFPK